MMYIAAFFSAMLAAMGVGGGMLLIMWLTIFGGFSQLEAQGINLLCFLPIAAIAVIIHSKNKLINWKRLFPVILSGLAAAAVGFAAAQFVGSEMLSKLFGGFIVIAGVKELFGKSGS